MNDSTVNDPTTSNAKKQVPVVVVCVQGGPGTVKTVISAIEANSPVLIVKGSGKAADLIAGAFPGPAYYVLLVSTTGSCSSVPDLR